MNGPFSTVSGTVTVREFAYGAWEDRETLEYAPLDQAVEASR